ncbi:Thiosulfate sulfurtransferase GlpE [Paraconexibacter sp. AEG42_29]|uniref:Thiosulfate sulfurtransferase GlpE n=1 Tax=Paraconexibacter sp. AEG42_29 TaxID=2997339 RepID=A0AAU7AWR3_9ACTN
MPRNPFARRPKTPAPRAIDPADALRGSSAGTLALIDVREPDEYAAGRPAGARNVPLSTLPAALDKLPPGPVALSCKSGARSQKAAKLALQAGRTDIHDVTGGYLAWEAAGLPTEAGP